MGSCPIALVGCGGVSPMHLDGYARHSERVRVVAACDPDPSRLQQAQQTYGIPAGFTTLEAMIAQGGWEVAVACTPTPVREAVVQTLATAGKHVFVEKPLADSLEEARRIVAICRDAGVLLAVNQNFRYHYPFDIARQVIGQGRIGNVVAILHQDLMFRQDSGWRVECPRHALSVMGIHWLDGFRWMLGVEARSVTCQTRSSPLIRCAGETDASVQMVMQNHTTVTYVESFSSPVGRTETRVLGERGMLTLGYDGAALWDPEHRKEPAERWTNPYGGSNKPESAFVGLDELLTAREQEREPTNSGQDNLRTVALLEAAYRSAERQERIDLEGGLLP